MRKYSLKENKGCPKFLVFMKNEAHRHFDVIWQAKIYKHGTDEKTARADSYKWLSEKLGVSEQFAHMSRMDAKTCNKVINICKRYNLKKTANDMYVNFDDRPQHIVFDEWVANGKRIVT